MCLLVLNQWDCGHTTTQNENYPCGETGDRCIEVIESQRRTGYCGAPCVATAALVVMVTNDEEAADKAKEGKDDKTGKSEKPAAKRQKKESPDGDGQEKGGSSGGIGGIGGTIASG
ncbi:hypothetical protein MMC25_001539 [Agyrium rufum]|nr:hypothetical protein [Agyrium rufum]